MTLLSLLPLASTWGVIQDLVMVLFVLTGLLLMLVVLVQEGKGGGIGGAFGGAGAEAFGVKAGTVNRFTAYVGTGFLMLALVWAGIEARINAPTDPNAPAKSAKELEGPAPGGLPPAAPPAAAPPVERETPGGTKPPEPAPAPAPAPAPEPAPAPAPAPAPEPAPAPAPAPAPDKPSDPPAMEG